MTDHTGGNGEGGPEGETKEEKEKKAREAREREAREAAKEAKEREDQRDREDYELQGHFKKKTNALIQKLAPAGLRRDVVALWGFLIESADDKNYWRLYLNLNFDAYIEYQKDDHVFEVHLANEQNPLGGTVVWITREARVYYSSSRSTSVQGSFMQGPIAGGYQGQGVMPWGIGGSRPGPNFDNGLAGSSQRPDCYLRPAGDPGLAGASQRPDCYG